MREDLQYITSADLPWQNFDGCTILVSGASGFLPFFMIETLLFLNDKFNINIKIIALVRNKEKSLKRFSRHLERDNLTFLFQDVCSAVEIDERVDYIIHAASQCSPIYYEKDPVGTLSANIVGTTNLLKLAKENSVRGFLFFSTGGVLGRIKGKNIPAKEEDYGYIDPINVRSCYNQSKKMAENICVSWNHQYGVPVKIVRPSYVYGIEMPLNDGRAFSNFLSNILNNTPLVVVNGERHTRSFCYISDATLAFFIVLLKGISGQPYNVGSEQETSIKKLATTMITTAGPRYNKDIVFKTKNVDDKNQRGSIDRSCFDITKIKSLGWTPRYDLTDGLERVSEYYRVKKTKLTGE